MKKAGWSSSIGDLSTHYVRFIFVVWGHFRRNPVNRRRDFVYWYCTCPIADVPEECFGALVRGYNKKQKSPWGSLGSLVAVSLEILNLNDVRNSSLTQSNQQQRTQCLRISFQIRSKHKRTHPSNRDISLKKGGVGRGVRDVFPPHPMKNVPPVHHEETGDLKDWRWICQAAATVIWALFLPSAAGIESTVHARWWLGQMAGVKKNWCVWCSRNLIILHWSFYALWPAPKS